MNGLRSGRWALTARGSTTLRLSLSGSSSSRGRIHIAASQPVDGFGVSRRNFQILLGILHCGGKVARWRISSREISHGRASDHFQKPLLLSQLRIESHRREFPQRLASRHDVCQHNSSTHLHLHYKKSGWGSRLIFRFWWESNPLPFG